MEIYLDIMWDIQKMISLNLNRDEFEYSYSVKT